MACLTFSKLQQMYTVQKWMKYQKNENFTSKKFH